MNKIICMVAATLAFAGCAEVDSKMDFSPTLAAESVVEVAHGSVAPPVAESRIGKIPDQLPTLDGLPSVSLMVTDAPVSEVLNALSKDTGVDFDVGAVEGVVTMAVHDRPLDEILSRLSEQAPIVWKRDNSGRIGVSADHPVARSYRLPVVAHAAKLDSDSHYGGSGSGENGGLTGGDMDLRTVSEKNLWASVENAVKAIVGIGGISNSATESVNAHPGKASVSLSRESGVLTVIATAKQHRQVKEYLDTINAIAKKQVFIDVKMVEVKLDSTNELGIDWKSMNLTGFVSDRNVMGAALMSAPHLMMGYVGKEFQAHLRMLGEQGKARMLSEPKLLVQNGQAATIRATDALVYFTTKVSQSQTSSTGLVTPPTITTTPHTIDVGVTMVVSPAISDDGQINLHIRPRVTRLLGYINDPNPLLAEQGIESKVPEIQQRELESTLVIEPGQEIALGGLILESKKDAYAGAPFNDELPSWLSWSRWLTGYNQQVDNRSELVFLISCRFDNRSSPS